MIVLFRAELADNSRRDTSYQCVARDVSGDNGSSGNHHIVTNRHPRGNCHFPANPDIVTNIDRFNPRQMLSSSCRHQWVVNRVNIGVGPDPHVIANVNLTDIQNGQIVISEEVVTHMDVLAVVKIKTAVDHQVFAGRSQDFPRLRLLPVSLVLRNCVKFCASVAAWSFRAATSGAPKLNHSPAFSLSNSDIIIYPLSTCLIYYLLLS